jgi:hypothetical protein
MLMRALHAAMPGVLSKAQARLKSLAGTARAVLVAPVRAVTAALLVALALLAKASPAAVNEIAAVPIVTARALAR